MTGTTTDGWLHPWLRIERAIRAILAVRLERGSREDVDRALMTVVRGARAGGARGSTEGGHGVKYYLYVNLPRDRARVRSGVENSRCVAAA